MGTIASNVLRPAIYNFTLLDGDTYKRTCITNMNGAVLRTTDGNTSPIFHTCRLHTLSKSSPPLDFGIAIFCRLEPERNQ